MSAPRARASAEDSPAPRPALARPPVVCNRRPHQHGCNDAVTSAQALAKMSAVMPEYQPIDSSYVRWRRSASSPVFEMNLEVTSTASDPAL